MSRVGFAGISTVVFVGATLLLLASPKLAEANAIDLTIAPNFNLAPGATFQIPATITNNTGADISFVNFDARFNAVTQTLSPQNGDTFAGAGESYPGSDPYAAPAFLTYTFGPSLTTSSVPFSEQFNNVVVPNGGTFSFVAATVQLAPSFPNGHEVFPLDYTFEITTYSPNPPVVVFSNTEQFAVTAVNVISEPSTLALFAMSLGAFFPILRGRRRKEPAGFAFTPTRTGEPLSIHPLAFGRHGARELGDGR